MSKLLVNLALLQTKAIVNAYTWTTLPLYAVVQRPWRRLKLARTTGFITSKDKHGQTVYSRPSPKELKHPYLNCYSFNEVVPLLDRSRSIFGVREVLAEVPQLDENGKPIKVDGRELKKITLTDSYKYYTVGEILDQVDALARGLQQLGVKKGEKVIIYSDNSLEWFIASAALMRLNAIIISLLSILNDEGIVYGINQCEAQFIVVSQDLMQRVNRVSDSIARPLNVVYIRNKLKPNDAQLEQSVERLKSKHYQVDTYDEVMEVGNRMPPVPFEVPDRREVAAIMYSSGTTGNPKGVLLTHLNLMTGMHNMLHQDSELDVPFLNSRYIAFLPMAHIFGLMMNFGLFISKAHIALSSPLTMLDSSPAHPPGQIGDIRLVLPEIMATVPLMLDRMIKEVYRKLEARSPLAAPLFTYLIDYKIRWKLRGFDTPIINRLLCKKIKEQFGGQLATFLVGSAQLNPRTQAMVTEMLDIKMIQAYGATEVAGASHMTHNESLTYGHSGVPAHSVKFKLIDWPEGGYFASDTPPRGEIVIGGDSVSPGYYKMPKETAESFQTDEEGVRWFLSGDIGELLPDGNLKIIDRKKDLAKLANGEYVSLGKIESGLRSSPFVENICICTTSTANHVTALISPNRRTMAELAGQLEKSHLSFDQLCDDAEVVNHIAGSLRARGKELGFASKELPVAICLVKEEWTPDSSLLTAALKMRRKQVNEFYSEQIKQMFDATKVE